MRELLGSLLLAWLLWARPPSATAQTTPPCDYTTTTVTLNSAGGSGNGTVRYVLADATGLIRQVSSTPTFSGLSGSQSYTTLAISHDGTAIGLSVGASLSAVTATCYNWSVPLPIRVCVVDGDSDGDGVTDTLDLCPGTPRGTPVNTYGCPKSVTVCDYTSSQITLNSIGGSGNGAVAYVLADSMGVIVQISSTPSFSGLNGSRTYMALALGYDGLLTGLAIGQPLSGVAAPCYDWSDALVMRVCVPAPTACDYSIGQTITLQTTGGTGPAGTPTRYLLVNERGVIVQIVARPTPAFNTAGLVAGQYAAYALVYSDDGSLANLQTGQRLTSVRADCLSVSDPLWLKLCVDCQVPVCLPIVVTRLKH